MKVPFADPDDETNAYWFVAHSDDIERSECDPEAAAELLLSAAEYLENGEVVPKPLAEFIATAFKRTASVEQRKRSSELAEYLNLTAKNRRPKASEEELGLCVFRVLHDNPTITETAALQKVSKQLDISKTAATEKWNKWKRTNRAFTEILKRVRDSKLK